MAYESPSDEAIIAGHDAAYGLHDAIAGPLNKRTTASVHSALAMAHLISVSMHHINNNAAEAAIAFSDAEAAGKSAISEFTKSNAATLNSTAALEAHRHMNALVLAHAKYKQTIGL